MRYLIEHGADKKAKDKNGYTALTEAASYGHLEVVDDLDWQGAKECSMQ